MVSAALGQDSSGQRKNDGCGAVRRRLCLHSVYSQRFYICLYRKRSGFRGVFGYDSRAAYDLHEGLYEQRSSQGSFGKIYLHRRFRHDNDTLGFKYRNGIGGTAGYRNTFAVHKRRRYLYGVALCGGGACTERLRAQGQKVPYVLYRKRVEKAFCCHYV